jgi:phosphatidylserine decarboxylase
LFRQIAGALARRIVWYVKEGDRVKQGEQFGFIKFGSRVDIFVPLGTTIRVAIGEVVKGGQTVLADLVPAAQAVKIETPKAGVHPPVIATDVPAKPVTVQIEHPAAQEEKTTDTKDEVAGKPVTHTRKKPVKAAAKKPKEED